LIFKFCKTSQDYRRENVAIIWSIQRATAHLCCPRRWHCLYNSFVCAGRLSVFIDMPGEALIFKIFLFMGDVGYRFVAERSFVSLSVS